MVSARSDAMLSLMDSTDDIAVRPKWHCNLASYTSEVRLIIKRAMMSIREFSLRADFCVLIIERDLQLCLALGVTRPICRFANLPRVRTGVSWHFPPVGPRNQSCHTIGRQVDMTAPFLFHS